MREHKGAFLLIYRSNIKGQEVSKIKKENLASMFFLEPIELSKRKFFWREIFDRGQKNKKRFRFDENHVCQEVGATDRRLC